MCIVDGQRRVCQARADGVRRDLALGVGLGPFALLDYGNSPALGNDPLEFWPETSVLQRQPGRPTVVMLAHPQCPCTRASLDELAIAVAQSGGRLDVHVIFLRFPAFELRSGLWRAVLDIPGAAVIEDPEGTETRKFGLTASVHTLDYHPAGALVYSGGLTSSRGHAGASRGREAIVDLARHGSSALAAFPVFGCALMGKAGSGQTPAQDAQ